MCAQCETSQCHLLFTWWMERELLQAPVWCLIDWFDWWIDWFDFDLIDDWLIDPVPGIWRPFVSESHNSWFFPIAWPLPRSNTSPGIYGVFFFSAHLARLSAPPLPGILVCPRTQINMFSSWMIALVINCISWTKTGKGLRLLIAAGLI